MKTQLQSFIAGILMLCVISFPASIAAQSFAKGSMVINAGIGFGSSISYWAGSNVSRTPVYALSGEYGVAKVGPGMLGLGVAFGYQGASYTDNYFNYYYKYEWTTTMLGFRGTYHPDFLNSDKYDVYGVVQLTYDHFSSKWSSNDPYSSTYFNGQSDMSSYMRFYLLVGGRYYFTKNFGVFGELGYDISYLKLGISLKFGGEAAAK